LACANAAMKNRQYSDATKEKMSKNGKGKVCQKGSKNSNWKGGRIVDFKGYVLVYAPTHPNCNHHGYVFEHRLVMEAHIGRTLLPTEVVHHINGDPADNRIENLALYSSKSDHSRHHCLIGKLS
jgi:hypothetical protein